jgi:hypothetical protein
VISPATQLRCFIPVHPARALRARLGAREKRGVSSGSRSATPKALPQRDALRDHQKIKNSNCAKLVWAARDWLLFFWF